MKVHIVRPILSYLRTHFPKGRLLHNGWGVLSFHIEGRGREALENDVHVNGDFNHWFLFAVCQSLFHSIAGRDPIADCSTDAVEKLTSSTRDAIRCSTVCC